MAEGRWNWSALACTGLMVLVGLVGCFTWSGCVDGVESRSGDANDTKAREAYPELEHAMRVLASDEPFVSRAQAVSVADQLVMAMEGKEPAVAARAARVAGDLRRRSYRTFHEVTDAREAIVQYGVASRSDDVELSCAARVAALGLRAEVESEARKVYLALYEESRKMLPTGCAEAARRAMDDLGAYRADAEQMADLDRRAAQGVSSEDGGTREEKVVKPQLDAVVGPATIDSVEVFSARDSARVVIHLTSPALYEVGVIAGDAEQGPRVFVDLAKTKRGKARLEREAEGLVRRVRVGVHGDRTRVVLDLGREAYKRVFYLPEPFRVVMDISTVAPQVEAVVSTAAGTRQVRRVVLDPGHGGRDPGAIGPGGLREKDVVLDIAHRAAPVLSREMGIVTMLTRDDDRFVPLEERAARANAFHADLFLSIHCNAAEDDSARGVQTFVLARAKDESAHRIAARENAASMAAGYQMGAVLEELRGESMAEQSWRMALLLQRATLASLSENYGSVPDGGVRSAAFFVLLGAGMPAVLFEASFLSNPQEEARLATADYRQKLADGIANAVRAYRDGR